MGKVLLNSDLHLAHKRVIEFEDNYRAKAMGVSTIEEHDEKIFDLWSDNVSKRDKIFILGDIGWNISPIKKLPGTKILLLGNHDEFDAVKYLEVFDNIIGPIKYKRHWLNHFPPHEQELWNRPVIHGHTHSKGLNDSRYINVSVEMTGGAPIKYQDIVGGKFVTWNRVNLPFGVVDNSVDNNPAKKLEK